MNWKKLTQRTASKPALVSKRRPRRLLAETLEERRLLAAVTRAGAGATPTELQGVVEQFQLDLGNPLNGANPGSAATGRREINWDGVSDALAAPNGLPANFFNTNSPRGVIFETLGTGFAVSAKAGNPTATAVRFGDLNPAYETQFRTFSAERLFTPLGNNVTDVHFFVPGTNLPATVRGFGAVFADVDIAGSTTLEFFDANQQSLGTPVVVSPLDSGLSFLGVTFDAGERIARVRITSGNVALGPGVVDGGGDDVVAMDDFLYAEPQGLGNLFLVDAANQLVRLNSNDPGALGVTKPITGLQNSEEILGIDFRPATGELYALGSSNQLYTINTATGAATAVGAALTVGLVGDSYGIDFNPTVDRLRVVSNSEQNLRINPNTGALVQEDTPLNPDGNVVAAAYSNNGPAATSTTLYGLDSNSDSLVRQGGVDGDPSPNGGVLTVIGALGVDIASAAGFDIAGGAGAAYAAMTVDGGVKLYGIDLTTGAATAIGDLQVTGPIRGLAVAIPPRVQITASTLVQEEDAGTTQAVLTVTLSEAATTAVTVDYTTQDGTALAGTDYDLTAGTLTFPAGSTSQQIVVPVRNDVAVNGNRTFKVVLSNLTGALALASEGTVTILDDDDPAPVAVDDNYATTEDEVLTVVAPGLLANDTNALSVSSADDTSTLGASIAFNADGSFTYDPTAVGLIQALAAGDVDEDTFSYTVSDLEGNDSTAIVRIALTGVNDAPVAVDDDVSAVPVQYVGEDEQAGFDPLDLLNNDLDADGDTLTILSVAPLSLRGAVISIRGDGFIDYNPDSAAELDALSAGQDILDSFEYTVSDGKGGTDTGTFTLKVIGANDAPVADDDAFAATPDAVLAIPPTQLLSNDSDVDQQDVLVIATVDPASVKGAVVTLNGDGSVSYDPTGVAEFAALLPGQSATDTFTYTLSDGQGGTSIATVTITVTPANHAPVGVDDTGAATANVVLTVPAAGVLANDTDPDAGDTLTAVAGTFTTAKSAAVILAADGGYTYDATGSPELTALPAGGIVEDSFTYTLRDAVGAEATATVRITVTGVNDAPVAGPDAGEAFEDVVLATFPGTLFGNDSDPDAGDTFEAELLTLTTSLGAKVGVMNNGSYFYDPRDAAQLQALKEGESIDDTFAYTIKDAAGLTATGTITITVHGANDAPVAGVFLGATNEDAVLSVPAASGLSVSVEDADDGDTLTFVASTFASQSGATVTIHEDGSFEYDPTNANTLRTLKNGEAADDTFEYVVRDAAGAEDTATVTITVTGTAADTIAPQFTVSSPSRLEGNDGQAALEFTVTLEFASFQTITMDYATADGTATVAGNDYAPASATLTFFPHVLTQTFTVQINGDTAAESNESFTVDITNAVNAANPAGSSTGTIQDDDNQPPTAVADIGGTDEDTVLTVTVPLIANDTDPDNHLPLTAVAETVTSAQGASATINADGTYTYDPTAAAALQALAMGAVIDDTFTYQVKDSLGATTPGTVTITVTGVNDTPTAGDDQFAANEDEVLTIAAPGILANDADVDAGDTLTIIAPTASNLGAIVTVNQDGSLSYDPRSVGVLQRMAAGASGVDIIVYALEDNQGASVTAEVEIIVTGVNDIPFAGADSYGVNEDELLTVDAATGLLDNDDDIDSGDVITVSAGNVTSTLGAAVVLNADGSFTYDPRGSNTLRTLAIGATAQDTFQYTLRDDHGGESTATVTVTVTGTTNDGQPKLTIGDVAQEEGDTGETIYTFTVTLAFASVQIVTADFETADEAGLDSATAGEDYTALDGTLTFPVGTLTQSFQIVVAGDTKLENDEKFLVNLSNAVGGEIDDNQAIGAITNDDEVPIATIEDVAVAEGDSGTTELIFTVTLANPSENTITIDYTTAQGTATAPQDYIAESGTVTFLPGETTATIAILVNGDELIEGNEQFTVMLSNPVGAQLGDPEAVGTISDDEDPPTISIGNGSVAEGNSGNADMTFTVSLSAASNQTVSVEFATASIVEDNPSFFTGIAAVGVDFLGTNGVVTFLPGETSKTIVVQVIGDLLREARESFSVQLSNPTNATIAQSPGASGVITDDDGPAIGFADRSVTEGDSGTAAMVFTVWLSQELTESVTVEFATLNGTATSPTDYAAHSGTLTFTPGQTSQTITIVVGGDVVDESDETFTISLSNATAGVEIARASATGTITDNDDPPTITIQDITVVEGNTGTVDAVFTVTLSAISGQDVTVNFATANGTATDGTDYIAKTGQVTIPAGVLTQTFFVQVTGDTAVEADEDFLVNFTNAVNATITDTQAKATIDDDDTPSDPTLKIEDATVVEGDTGTVELTFTVTLSAAQTGPVTVQFATSNGTAIAPDDYAAKSGTLTFAAGDTTETITILVASDALDEAAETLTVTLSNPTSGVTLLDATATGTINDNGNDSPPLVSINDPLAVAEGNTGTVDLVFTVTISAASGQTITVPFSLAGTTTGTSATLGTDFEAQTGEVIFEPGQPLTKTITVKVIGDTLDESTETFQVSLGAPTNASLTDGVGIGTINDDDPAAQGPTLSIGDANVVEGNNGTQNMVFTVTLSASSTSAVTVNFATSNNTATAGEDYTAASGTLTFNPGVTTQMISVPIAGDATVEPHETFTVTLTQPSAGVTFSDASAAGTITNDDGPVNMSITNATVNEGNTATTTATFTVTLSAASSQTVSVAFATAAGTATSGTDFVATSGTLTFNPGEVTKTIAVTVNGDALDEANETFSVVLSGAANATLLDDTGAGSITDDDAPPTISIADQQIAEGNTGTKTITFTVALSAVSGLAVNVNFATAGVTATSGTDFVAGSGLVTVPAGQSSATFTVTINGDTTVESNETFTVTLSNPTNATILDGAATGTITDDDAAVTISIADATVTEGDSGTIAMTFTVTLSAASGQTVTVNFATADGTATQPGDYAQNTGTLTFAPGETSKTITVNVAGDSLDESNETFTVNLTSPSGATLADGTATGTITDNDTAGTLQFGSAVFTVNENGGVATITVTRTGGTAANVTVNFATTNGTAAAGSDYTTASGTLTFLAGEASKTFTVPILNDAALEALESINLTLSTPGGGATLGAQSTATLNITDDDGNANQRFVNNLYEDLLGRTAEQQGIDFYVDLMQRGQSRGDIAFMIQHSLEYRNKLVSDLYQELLGRPADPAGLDVHARLLARGKSIDEVRAALLSSDEFFTRRGGGTNEGFVNALYQAVLGRAVDPTGREIYNGVLSSGGNRNFVAREVLKSIEADRRLSSTFYTKFLSRAADNAGNEFQASALNRGTYEPRVLAGIMASDEYFSKL